MTSRSQLSGGVGLSQPSDALAARVRRRFVDDGADATTVAVTAAVRAEDGAALLGEVTLRRLAGRLAGDLAGAGPLSPLLADPTVTDVLVDLPGDARIL